MRLFKATLLISALTVSGGLALAQSADEHAGHDMPATQGDAAAHDAKTSENPDRLWSQADAYWGKEAMDEARAHEIATMGGLKTGFIMADRFEAQLGDTEDTYVWDGQGWYGTDDSKLWIKTEGEYSSEDSEIEDAELQALWSKPIATYWDLQIGARYDFAPKGRTHLVAGVQGLAPYWFEVDAAAFVSTNGDVTARIEAEYDFILTQRLILQPRAEINLSAQDIPELQIGAGITGVDAGIRLRYEFVREFAPYIGVEWQGSLGDTSDFIKAAGGETDKTVFLIGIRAWH